MCKFLFQITIVLGRASIISWGRNWGWGHQHSWAWKIRWKYTVWKAQNFTSTISWQNPWKTNLDKLCCKSRNIFQVRVNFGIFHSVCEIMYYCTSFVVNVLFFSESANWNWFHVKPIKRALDYRFSQCCQKYKFDCKFKWNFDILSGTQILYEIIFDCNYMYVLAKLAALRTLRTFLASGMTFCRT